MLAAFMKKDPQTYTVLDAAMEVPGFEPGDNLRKSCQSAVIPPVPGTTLDSSVVKIFGK